MKNHHLNKRALLSILGLVCFSGAIAWERVGSAQTPSSAGASVVDVTTSGSPGNYSMSVTVESPDTGCERYANWWEVVTPDGELLYRRILLHSHVDEQPFTRSGSPVDISPDREVIVRAHMHPDGYGPQSMRGSVTAGWETVASDPEFAPDLATQAPLSTDCLF